MGAAALGSGYPLLHRDRHRPDRPSRAAVPDPLDTLAARGQLVSGGGVNPFTSARIASILRIGGLDAYLYDLRRILHRRLTVMDQALYTPPATDGGEEQLALEQLAAFSLLARRVDQAAVETA